MPATDARRPKVSVVMPAFNAERYIEAAVESILAQTFSDFEFIIVDDGSTDSSPAIMRRFAAADTRIKVIVNKTNMRFANSANRAISIARGRYIARMDADDISAPERLEKQAAFLDENPDFVVVGSGYDTINAQGRTITRNVESTTPWECAWMSLFRMPLVHPTTMYRKSVVDDFSLRYDNAYDGAADFEFFHRLLGHGKAVALRDILVQYRTHTENVSTRRSQQQRRAALAAATKESLFRFPTLQPEAVEALFDFIYGDEDIVTAQIATAISGLRALEAQFLKTHALSRKDVARLRTLAARWLSAAALRRGLPSEPAKFAQFLWIARDYLAHAPGETLNYAQRRMQIQRIPV